MFGDVSTQGIREANLTEMDLMASLPRGLDVILNVDGSCIGTLGKDSFDGLRRDGVGKWFGGFYASVGFF